MPDAAIAQPAEINSLLAEMDLNMDGLKEVVRFADAERALVSLKHDTPGLDQALVYHKAGRGLRDVFCGKCWEIDNSDNHTAIKHRSKPLRVVPCNFDENTGNQERQPRNRTDKGAVMAHRTLCNATPLLFEENQLPIRRREERATWLLGVYSVVEQPLRAELGLPVAFLDKHITSLAKRIVIFDGTEEADRSRKDNPGPVDIVDINIRPRA